MNDILVYPAIFDYSEPPGPSISFPDFPGLLSEADDNVEAMYMARDALSGRIYILERENIPLPEPSDPVKLIETLAPSQVVTLIDVNMRLYRKRQAKSSNVNTMCTMPEWLRDEAKSQGINFSQTLQNAVMENLGLTLAGSRRKVS
ncbi:MAG: type II toxin-antitoxin system HicB family antitoxin [Synergistaceae bacterium]|nr:type II toxin-antitoxin system HicB family antitoxin [Synergistaceae bacterium]